MCLLWCTSGGTNVSSDQDSRRRRLACSWAPWAHKIVCTAPENPPIPSEPLGPQPWWKKNLVSDADENGRHFTYPTCVKMVNVKHGDVSVDAGAGTSKLHLAWDTFQYPDHIGSDGHGKPRVHASQARALSSKS